ncbi:MAG: helix-turn-helix transcriptional regulator [Anaerolineaceae bacterium]|jgi:transcriptional regulator with XRE-family HTH domain
MNDSGAQKKVIANRLRIAREFAGLSQTQAANQLHLHRPTISEIEAGRRNVTAEELVAFSQLYDVNISWITDEQSSSDDTTSERVEFAARELSKLKQEDLDQLITLLKALRKS